MAGAGSALEEMEERVWRAGELLDRLERQMGTGGYLQKEKELCFVHPDVYFA